MKRAPLSVVERDDWHWGPGEIRLVPLGRAATVSDLRRTRLKAEIVRDRMLVIGPSTPAPAIASGAILMGLREFGRMRGGGRALGSRVAFLVALPHRLSLCPDASWFTGDVEGDGFPRGAPVFAAEVRDWSDYGPAAERRLAAKRADYFAAGTAVVWDVDVLREEVVRVYRAGRPDAPDVFRRGDTAEAEPAVPGWRFPVDELFD